MTGDQVTDDSATSATPPETPELIWLRPERTGRGPRPAHSRDSIAAAAVTIADAEGLDAVSMRRVATALGAGTMSLYNYVPKKEQLFDLMLDAVVGEYELPASPSGDQRTDLQLLFRQQLEILRRHTWVPRLVVGRPSLGPNGLRYTEYFLACLGCIKFFATEKRSDWNPFLHLIIPVLGIALIIPAWLTAVGIRAFHFVSPLAYPYDLVGPIVGGWLLIGLIYFVYLLRRAPERLDAVGQVFLSEDDELSRTPSASRAE